MEEKKVKLFREKSLEAVESPEALNDYLRVTSPGVWLVMAAVIVLLIGAVLWGIFGRIDTKAELAVSSQDGKAVCYVPYEAVEQVMRRGSVEIDGKAYALDTGADATVTIVTEEMNPFVRVLGNLSVGDVTVEVPLNDSLEDGVYKGTVITESLQPISLLLR